MISFSNKVAGMNIGHFTSLVYVVCCIKNANSFLKHKEDNNVYKTEDAANNNFKTNSHKQFGYKSKMEDSLYYQNLLENINSVRGTKESNFQNQIINGNMINNLPINPLSSEPFIGHHADKSLDSQSRLAPKYMLELYEKFETERYAHPVSNIVRSFHSQGTAQEGSIGASFTQLKFNLSSISYDEDIYLAELRLYAIGAASSITKVSISQTLTYTSTDTPQKHEEHIIATKHILRHFTGWETFPFTDFIKQWAQNKDAEVQVFNVQIHSNIPWDTAAVQLTPGHENQPLLVVFSNDKNKETSAERDLREMLQHEMDLMIDAEDYLDDYTDEDDDDYFDDYEVVDSIDDLEDAEVHEEGFADVDKINSKTEYEHFVRKRSTRLKKHRRRHRKRNSCRRKPLYVNFQDINWHNWIIAPVGYQAYECTGRCYYPLSDHLTPTNHAIIQTLVHMGNKRKVSRACCVPTRLDPISILYIDERGIVTYKYKYEDMVVAECGCR